MIKVNYHIHSNYCDGKNSLEEMVQAAIKEGLISIGLTSHMTLPFENDMSILPEKLQCYFAEIDELKIKFQDRIEIYKGLEIDYFIDREQVSETSEKVMKTLDYLIMSIHSMGSTRDAELYYIDKSPENFRAGIEKFYAGSIEAFIKDYYQAIASMVKKYHPQIVGHLDLVKKFNQNSAFFEDQKKWYQDAVCDCLDQIAATNALIEINTGANLRTPGVGRYPSDWIIPEMKKRNIPITFGGDSHSIAGIATQYEEAENYLLECGYEEYYLLRKGQWKPCAFE